MKKAFSIGPSHLHILLSVVAALLLGLSVSAQHRAVLEDEGTVKETPRRQSTVNRAAPGTVRASKPNNSVLFIETDRPDPEVKINGISKGKATNGELKLELPTGRRYNVEVTAGPDYLPAKESIVLTSPLVFKAVLQSKFGAVRIGPRFRDGRGELRIDGQRVPPDRVQVDQESDLIVIGHLAPGERTIAYDHPDYVIVEHSFNISPGSDFTWTFQPELAVDELLVETLPGASVYVDGKHYGETAGDGKLKVSVPLGKYETKLEKYGFSPYKAEFDFKFRAPVTIRQTLTPLPNSAEFHDYFDIPEAFRRTWSVPASGWNLEKSRLHLGNCEFIYPKAYYYNDFTMAFHLKLENRGGAAWIVRAKDPKNYYLFYVTGPEGPLANEFLTYIVRDGKLDAARPDDSVPLPFHLEAAGEYSIEISAKKNVIENFITPTATGRRFPVGVLKDNDNLFPYGGIGFRTVGSEKFSVGELFVRPPEVKAQSGIATPGQPLIWPETVAPVPRSGRAECL
jgi:hypothetical protein